MRTHLILKNRIICAGSLVALMGLFATDAGNRAFAADAENRGLLSSSDYKFAVAAAEGGTLEVDLGRLAQEKSVNDSIKQFGRHMVEQHGQAGRKLAQIGTQKGASLPATPSTAQQKEIDRLAKLSGPEFDKAYIALMIKDHKEDLKEYKKAVEKVQDADLKAFAVDTVPIVEDHLKMAQGIEDNLKGKQVSAVP